MNRVNEPKQVPLSDVLKQYNTIGEMVNFVLTHYNIGNIIIPPIYKPLIIQGLVKAVQLLTPKK